MGAEKYLKLGAKPDTLDETEWENPLYREKKKGGSGEETVCKQAKPDGGKSSKVPQLYLNPTRRKLRLKRGRETRGKETEKKGKKKYAHRLENASDKKEALD